MEIQKCGVFRLQFPWEFRIKYTEKMRNEKSRNVEKSRNMEECSIGIPYKIHRENAESPYKIPMEKKEKIRKAHMLLTNMHIHIH